MDKEVCSISKKDIKVKEHDRSKPSRPAWKGPGKKPGPKNVSVDQYKRSRPSS